MNDPIVPSIPATARRVEHHLAEALGAPSAGFAAHFALRARALGAHDAEDLASIFLIDCWQARARGETLDAGALRRILDTARHRVMRVLIRQRNSTAPERPAEPPPSATPLLADEASRLISMLSPEEAAILLLYADGVAARTIADTLGLSRATVFRRLDAIRTRFAGRDTVSEPAREPSRRG